MARRLLIAGLILLALVVAAGLLVRRLVNPEAVRAAVEQQASAALGQPVKVGALDWAGFARPRVVLSDVQIGSPAAITLRRVELTTGLRALLSKRVEGAGVVISGSRVVLPLPIVLGAGGKEASASSTGNAATALTIASIDRISLSDIELAVGGTQLRLDVESSLAGDRLVVSRIRLASEHTAIDGSGEFSSLSARRGVFSATANPLDLDELLTIASGFSGSTPRSGSAAAGAQGSVARPAPLDVRFRLKAPRGRVLGIDFTNLATTMAVTRDGIGLEPFAVGLFDGTIDGRLHLDTTQEPSKVSVSAKAAAMDVAKLAAVAGSAGVMTGRLDGQIDLHAEAGVPEVVFRTAGGRGTLAISDGTMPYLDLVGPMILAFGKPDAAKTTARSSAFSRLGGTFTLAGGVLRTDDLAMTSRDVDLKGHGTLRVAGAQVAVKADVILSEALSSQAGRDLYRYAHEGSRVVLPATISGSLASPSVSLDAGAALQRGMRNALDDQVKKGLGRLFKQ